MSLAEYRSKRDFKATPEPGPERAAKTGRQPLFVIQLHHARARHFDFRLEIDGVLKSWAVPKGPSLVVGEKRLAVEVEDHPLSYAKFAGTIPKGHYGAGTVEIWDRGHWTTQGSARAQFAQGKLRVELHGERLHGIWKLVRTASRKAGSKTHWLLFKSPEEPVDATLPKTTAAKSERASRPARAKPVPRGLAGPKLPAPDKIEFQLCRQAQTAPDGDGWLHEIKYDGYRMLIWRQGADVRIFSRNHIDWTAKLPHLVRAVGALRADGFVMDSELIALDQEGRSGFGELQRAISELDHERFQLAVFDLLFLAGEDLRTRPLLDRRRELQALLRERPAQIVFSDAIEGHGPEVFKAACEHGLEGTIAKRSDAPYRGDRSGAWIKLKCVHSEEFVVIGYTAPKGARSHVGRSRHPASRDTSASLHVGRSRHPASRDTSASLHVGSLLLARVDPAGQWRYCGRVGAGLGDKALADLRKRLKTVAARPDWLDPSELAKVAAAKPAWVEPALVVEVFHRGWTEDGMLRQASFKTVRDDKSVSDFLPRKARATKSRATTPRATAPPTKRAEDARAHGRKAAPGVDKSPAGDPTIAGVTITSPERVVFRDADITKLELARYYETVAAWILPELVDRPLSLVRCPDGIDKACFYQKHHGPGFGPSVKQLEIPAADGSPQAVVYVRDLAGVIALVQMNVLEFHPWPSRVKSPERPDRLVFDLDPGPGVAWRAVAEGALATRALLAQYGLVSFLRTSGGKGLHVVVPLRPAATWERFKGFAAYIARQMVAREPNRYLAVATKSKRENKIFVDYLRNTRGATSIASYSARARPGAPVATPLAWQELARLEAADAFNIENIPRRIATLKSDPWKDLATIKQSLPPESKLR